MTAFAWPTSAACLRTSSIEVGAGVVKPIWVPPLKSMPRLSPRTPSARTETTITAAEIPNHSRRRLMKSILSHGLDAAARGADHARVVEELRAGEQREERARREHGREHRDRGTDQEHEGESAHRRGGDREQHERGDRGDDVGVDDRREALRVAGLDRGPDAPPGARLFLDAFEDDDVRVGGHPQRQHEAGEAREGQRHVEDEDRGVEEGGVDAEAEHRDERRGSGRR